MAPVPSHKICQAPSPATVGRRKARQSLSQSLNNLFQWQFLFLQGYLMRYRALRIPGSRNGPRGRQTKMTPGGKGALRPSNRSLLRTAFPWLVSLLFAKLEYYSQTMSLVWHYDVGRYKTAQCTTCLVFTCELKFHFAELLVRHLHYSAL